MKTWMVAVATAALALSVSACNTVDGAEKDVKSVAKEVDQEL